MGAVIRRRTKKKRKRRRSRLLFFSGGGSYGSHRNLVGPQLNATFFGGLGAVVIQCSSAGA